MGAIGQDTPSLTVKPLGWTGVTKGPLSEVMGNWTLRVYSEAYGLKHLSPLPSFSAG